MISLLAVSGPIPFDAVLWLLLISLFPLASFLVLLIRLARRRWGRSSSSPILRTSWVDRTWLLWASAAILSLYGAAFLYGYFIESQWVELTTTEVRMKKAVLGRDRLRIVHLTDLHMSRFGRLERRVVDLVREARPDLILITGDYGNSEGTPEAIAEMFQGLSAPLGVYAVRGNNDWPRESLKALKSAGVDVLMNEVKTVKDQGKQMEIVGQDFITPAPLHRILSPRKDEAYTIFIAHKPDAVDELAQLEPRQHVDLFLCGHTHGGQVCLPFWGAVVTESKYHKKYERGLYDVHGVPMYVNRGIGTVGIPIRIMARPEVAIIDLVVR